MTGGYTCIFGLPGDNGSIWHGSDLRHEGEQNGLLWSAGLKG